MVALPLRLAAKQVEDIAAEMTMMLILPDFDSEARNTRY